MLEFVRERVKKWIVVPVASVCWTHLLMFTVSTVLGDKASDVEQSWGESAKLLESRPPPHWAVRGQLNEDHMFGQLKVLLLVCFRGVHGWMGINVWVNFCFYDAIFVRRLWTVEKDV